MCRGAGQTVLSGVQATALLHSPLSRLPFSPDPIFLSLSPIDFGCSSVFLPSGIGQSIQKQRFRHC